MAPPLYLLRHGETLWNREHRIQGWQDSPFNLQPAKGAYMWRDLERRAEALGIDYRKPSVYPPNSLLPARIARLAQDAETPGP